MPPEGAFTYGLINTCNGLGLPPNFRQRGPCSEHGTPPFAAAILGIRIAMTAETTPADRAEATAECCAGCGRPLAPTDSVTMIRFSTGSPRTGLIWHRAPICLLCTLVDLAAPVFVSTFRGRSPFPKSESVTFFGFVRTRCRGCGRPIRLGKLDAWDTVADFSAIKGRTCCRRCERKAISKRNSERQRVHHEERIWVQCGKAFEPKRADAVTCSNRCRQAQHRRRAKAGP